MAVLAKQSSRESCFCAIGSSPAASRTKAVSFHSARRAYRVGRRGGRMGKVESGSAEWLKQLWEHRVAVILSNLEHHEEQHREIANAASHIGTDYHGRFLIELIQNASDQVAKAEGTVSTIVVVRTHQCVAVMNEGIPFDDKGVKRITSLALSGKNAEENLGNKGIGFKAVFQVSDGPEIYSAKSAHMGLRDGLGYAFRLDSAPLSRDDVSAQMRSIVERLLVDRPDARSALIAKAGQNVDPLDIALDEIAAAPPWKFPLPRSPADLESQVRALGLRDEWVESMQTLVVLPLTERGTTLQDVTAALSELRSQTALLFLPRIREIIIIDRVAGTAERIQKRIVGAPQPLPAGRELSTWELSSGPLDDEPTSLHRWWVMSRTLGAPQGVGDHAAMEERQAIKSATAGLPGEGWSDVEHATVSIALPQPAPDSCELQPERGLFCIGLPTRVETGTPLWVDAHFHGNVPRTDIDFSLAYNGLLLDEATRLVTALIDELKRAPTVDARRSVTLAMDWTEGALASLLRDARFSETAVVLAADGVSYLPGDQLAMPMAEDSAMLDVLTNGDRVAALEAGFALPEAGLFAKKRALLDSLAPEPDPEQPGYDKRFLARPNGGKSLLERAAERCRLNGSTFWEPFLDWATKRFPITELEDQEILPVGAAELASADERVFIEPMPRASEAEEDDEIDISTMPEEVRRVLRFLDGTAFPVRVAGKKDLTPIASKLSPSRGPTLVAPARIDQLIEHAVAPKLAEIAADPSRSKLALELLQFAVSLARRLSPKAHSLANLASLVVPAGGRGQPWEWVDPTGVYFGAGWCDDPETEKVLETAFGHRPRGLLVPWNEFAIESGAKDEERGWWFRGLQTLGVATHPRLLTADRVNAFRAWSYDHLTPVGMTCPIPGAAPFWDSYQRTVGQRKTDRKTGQTYEIVKVSWIDGLESEKARAAVFRLALARAEDYVRDATTSIRRVDLGDPREALSLWTHAILSQEWPIIPVEGATDTATAPPSQAWWLSSDERRKESSKLLTAVPASFAAAEPLLKKLGILTLADAGPSRLIRALHRLSTLPAETLRDRATAARALVGELWDRLRAHCVRLRATAPLDLRQIVEAPVPLFRGRALEVVDLRQIDALFVNDDPIRGTFVPGLEGSLQLPPLRDVHALVIALRSVIGEHRVVMTSEAPVVTHFTPSPGESPSRFLDLLALEFPDVDVPVDLALLRAYVGRADIDPQKREFTDFWASMERLVVQRGVFGDGDARTGSRSFYDSAAGVLQVAHDATPLDIVIASWPLATVSHREVWVTYGKALADRSIESFFAERQIGETERQLVESITRRGRITRLSPLRSAVFAVALSRSLADPDSFDATWEDHAGSVADLARWLGADLEEPLLLAVSALSEEDAVIPILRAAEVPIAAWQHARVVLGLPRWSFSKTRETFIEARDALVAALKSEPVRFPTVNLAVARGAIEALSALTPDEEVLATLLDFGGALQLVARRAHEIFTKLANRPAIAILADRVAALAAAKPEEHAKHLDDLGTLREKEIYRRDPEVIRSHHAKEERDNLLRVAVPLATSSGETLDPLAVVADQRIAAFSDGWWANRWAVLVSLQRVIDAAAPKTARALSDERAFRDHMDWRLLWTKFPQLGPVAAATAAQKPPPRRIPLFGNDEPADTLEDDLRAGSAGKIGEAMERLVSSSLDLAALGTGVRATLVDSSSDGARGTKGGKGGGGGAEARADRELNGLLGEIFVYEQFRRLLDDFDEYAWKSENRTNYGFSAGQDGLGYDFLYIDRAGKLTGSPGLECRIEVKATSGDGSAPFPMTTPEWDSAQACHYSGGKSCFLIVRVADVRTAPRIVDIIRDPFALWKARNLTISARDLWVRVAAAAAASVPTLAK